MSPKTPVVSDLAIANLVGSGDLEKEIDLAVVASAPEFTETRWIKSVEHSRRYGNRLNIRFRDRDTLGILAPTGVTTITGAKTFDALYASNDDLISALVQAGVVSKPVEDGFDVRNIVCVGDLEREIDLDALAIGLGLELVEYEPEQFPGAVYRSPGDDCTLFVFATGKIVLTGLRDLSAAERAFDNLQNKLTDLLGS